MATALELGFQELFQAIASDLDADHSFAETDDIGVLMLARQPRAEGIVDQGGADFRVAVGGHGDAGAGAADEDAAPGLPSPDGRRERIGIVRIIDRVRPVGAEVDDGHTHILQVLLEDGFEPISGMVAGDDDGFRGHGFRPLPG